MRTVSVIQERSMVFLFLPLLTMCPYEFFAVVGVLQYWVAANGTSRLYYGATRHTILLFFSENVSVT